MLEELCARVCAANRALATEGLAPQTWGNASAIDREAGLVVIKPSGVAYADLTPADMAIVDLEAKPRHGRLSPSVDLPTHLALYQAFEAVGGIVHTHSHFAVCWAQARRPIPCLGTTHADYFHGEVPVARPLRQEEMDHYESNIGRTIVECFWDRDPSSCPAVLCAGHAPFAWGATVEAALENAIVLEEVARMALHTQVLVAELPRLEPCILDKHFLRKHGPGRYYGQA